MDNVFDMNMFAFLPILVLCKLFAGKFETKCTRKLFLVGKCDLTGKNTAYKVLSVYHRFFGEKKSEKVLNPYLEESR